MSQPDTAFADGVLHLKKTFTRSQLAAISSILMDFKDFMRFHGFPWMPGDGDLGTSGAELDGSPAPDEAFARSQLAAISLPRMGFRGFHEISKISMDSRGRGFGNEFR